MSCRPTQPINTTSAAVPLDFSAAPPSPPTNVPFQNSRNTTLAHRWRPSRFGDIFSAATEPFLSLYLAFRPSPNLIPKDHDPAETPISASNRRARIRRDSLFPLGQVFACPQCGQPSENAEFPTSSLSPRPSSRATVRRAKVGPILLDGGLSGLFLAPSFSSV